MMSEVPYEFTNSFKSIFILLLTSPSSGFGGLEVACWPLVPKFAGSGRKNPQRAFLRKGSKAVCPMS